MKKKIIIICILIGICCFITWYFHAILETGIIFTHFFYIPVILACIWWRKKGLVVPVFLAVLLILTHFFIREVVANTNDYLRAIMFIIIGFVVALLSERIAKLHRKANRKQNYTDNIISSMIDTLIVVNPDATIRTINKATEDILGYTENELTGKPVRTVFAEEDTTTTTIFTGTGLEKLIKKGFISDSERTYITKSGKKIPVLFSGSVMRDEKGNIQGIVCVASDITERKQIEEKLKESEEKYRSMMEAMIEPTYICSSDFRISYLNPSMIKRIGYDATSEYCYKAIHGLDKKCKWCVFEKVKKEGHIITDIVSPKDGRSYSVSSSPIYQPDGTIFKMTIYRDITEQKQTEESLKRSKDKLQEQLIKSEQQRHAILNISKDLEELNKKLKHAKEAAEEANKAKSNFIAHISHELRTPLTGIIGMSNMLLKTYMNDTQKEYLDNIKGSGNILLSVINDILDISKIDAGKIELSIAGFNIRGLLKDVINSLEFRAKEKGINLFYKVKPGVPVFLKGDTTRISQILINLLGNAIKFTAQGKVELLVALIKQEPVHNLPASRLVILHFSVKDTGIGIPRDKQEKIFEIFTQADTSTTKTYGGTGMGLSITKKLVEMMNGKILVDSTESKGSTFTFTLQLEISDVKIIPEDVKKPDILAQGELIGPYKILIAEDNFVNQKYIEALLLSWNFEVLVANNGKEVIEIYENEKDKIDCIVMDIFMPEMDGLEATKLIREKEKQTGNYIPIIAVTAAAIVGNEEEYLSAGMDDYISKPIDETEFINKIIKYIIPTKQKIQTK